MFDFSLLGSFLMDASNLLQFGKGASDLAVNDDETSRSGSRFEVALVRPSLSRTDRWLLKMTQATINMAHTFGETCINLETATLRSQLWADQCKARLVGAGT